MPFKINAERRHRIPRQRHRATNRPAYEAGPRARGSLTVWFTAEAVAAWRAEPRTSRGGQARYSALAIATAPTLRAVFRLALRQTEGLIASILALLGLHLAVPDHSTPSRRAEALEMPRPHCRCEPVHHAGVGRLCIAAEWGRTATTAALPPLDGGLRPVPRRPLGERAMTPAERQARTHARREERHARWRNALERILEARTVREARAIAAKALDEKPPEE